MGTMSLLLIGVFVFPTAVLIYAGVRAARRLRRDRLLAPAEPFETLQDKLDRRVKEGIDDFRAQTELVSGLGRMISEDIDREIICGQKFKFKPEEIASVKRFASKMENSMKPETVTIEGSPVDGFEVWLTKHKTESKPFPGPSTEQDNRPTSETEEALAEVKKIGERNPRNIGVDIFVKEHGRMSMTAMIERTDSARKAILARDIEEVQHRNAMAMAEEIDADLLKFALMELDEFNGEISPEIGVVPVVKHGMEASNHKDFDIPNPGSSMCVIGEPGTGRGTKEDVDKYPTKEEAFQGKGYGWKDKK